MTKIPKYEFEDAVTTLAANVFVKLDGSFSEEEILKASLQEVRIDANDLVLAQGGLAKLLVWREDMRAKVQRLRNIDPNR